MDRDYVVRLLKAFVAATMDATDDEVAMDDIAGRFYEKIAQAHEEELAKVKMQVIDRLLDLAAGEELYQNTGGGRTDWKLVRDTLRAAAKDLRTYFGLA